MLSTHIQAFKKIRPNVNRQNWTALTKYGAPYKPLLLMTVFDLIAQGAIKNNFIELTPEFCETFTLYWSRIMPLGRKGNIAMPFFYLTSDGFWHLVPYPSREAELQTIRKRNINLTTISQLKEMTIGAKLDDELFELLKVKENRETLRAILIARFFAPEAEPLLLEQSQINNEAYLYSLELLDEERKFIDTEEIKPAARSQGFRIAIVKTYEHRCTTCGIRVLTADGHTIVEAAHIIPFSISKDDDPRNGLCLCRSCHWSFDEGLITVSKTYEVMTSPQLSNYSNMPSYLGTLDRRNIIHPFDEKFLPALENIDWHRKEVFRV